MVLVRRGPRMGARSRTRTGGMSWTSADLLMLSSRMACVALSSGMGTKANTGLGGISSGGEIGEVDLE